MIRAVNYFSDLTHKITVAVAGVGGTGSHILSNLARMHKVLKMLNHPGISVRAYDPDNIEETNIGRQLFFPADIGLNKACVMISRINRTYGLDWEAVDEYFVSGNCTENIVISCTDNPILRIELSEFPQKYNPNWGRDEDKRNYYWIDIGNEKMRGQIYLSDYGVNFQNFAKVFPMIADRPKEKTSCNIIDSLNAQELFINEFMATLTVDFLYRILRSGEIHHNVIYADLENYNIQTNLLLDKKE